MAGDGFHRAFVFRKRGPHGDLITFQLAEDCVEGVRWVAAHASTFDDLGQVGRGGNRISAKHRIRHLHAAVQRTSCEDTIDLPALEESERCHDRLWSHLSLDDLSFINVLLGEELGQPGSWKEPRHFDAGCELLSQVLLVDFPADDGRADLRSIVASYLIDGAKVDLELSIGAGSAAE